MFTLHGWMQMVVEYILIFYCALNNAAIQFINSYFYSALNFILDKFRLSFISEDNRFIKISK